MRLTNRRRPNIPRILLRLSLLLLAAECLAALFLSPRLWVRQVRIEGNRTVSGERLWERMRLAPHRSLVMAPVARLRAAVEAEPSIARAEIHHRFPDTLVVRVQERAPWASVNDGFACYTIDRNWVPFRKSHEPEPGLPRIVVSIPDRASLRLGRLPVMAGIPSVNKCLLWSGEHPEFPLNEISVDQTGKLCLNRVGGAEVRLGSGVDVVKKLDTLAVLLARRPEVKSGDFTYINLFAHDAPAIYPRPPLPLSSAPGSVRRPDG